MADQKTQGMFKHSVIYWVGSMLTKMIGFLLLPIYTRYLDPSEYGVLELVALTADSLCLVIGMQISSAIYKYYHQAENKNEVISTALLTLIIISLISSVVGCIYSNQLSMLIFTNDNNALYFRIMIIGAFAGLLTEITMVHLRLKDESKTYVIISVAQVLCMISLNLYFITILNLSVLGAFLGSAIVSVVFSISLTIYTLRNVTLSYDLNLIIKMLRYSMPLIPGGIGLFIVHFCDRFFLARLAPISEVGIYALGYKLGFLISPLVAKPFDLMWNTRLFSFYESKEKEKLYNSVLKWLSFVVVWVGLCICLFVNEVLLLMTTEGYYRASEIVPIIVFAYAIHTTTSVIRGPLWAENKTPIIGYINVSAAIISLVLYYFLIRLYGVYGAAFSTLAVFLFIFISTVISVNKTSHIKWDWFMYIKPFSVGITIYAIAQNLPYEHGWLLVLTKISLLLAYVAVLWMIGFIDENSKKKIKSYVSHRLQKY